MLMLDDARMVVVMMCIMMDDENDTNLIHIVARSCPTVFESRNPTRYDGKRHSLLFSQIALDHGRH